MRRKSIGCSHEMPVQPAFIIGTYNEDGTPNFAPITWVCECEVQSIVNTGESDTFYCRVKNVQIDERVGTDNWGIDLTLLNPVIYSGSYHSIGKYLGEIGDFYSTESR